MNVKSGSRSTWSRAADLAIEVPAVIVTFVMMVQITANAVLRAYFKQPIDYTLEMTQYWYMPIVAMLGFMAAQRRGQHIAADLIFTRLPRPTQIPVLSVLYVVAAVVSAGFAYYGWGEAVEAYDIRKHAGISPLPAWPVYFLVPITFAVMTVQYAFATVHTLRHGVGESIEEAEMHGIELEMAEATGPAREER